MKKIGQHILLSGAALVLSVSTVFAEEDYEWLKDHIVVRTTERIDCDAKGDVVAVNTTKRSSVTVNQTLTEQKKKDKQGVLRVVSRVRTTVTTNTDGCQTRITEREMAKGKGMVVTNVSTTKKTPNGQFTIIKARNKKGDLVVVSKTTTSTNGDGSRTTIVERPGKNGDLMIKQSTTTF